MGKTCEGFIMNHPQLSPLSLIAVFAGVIEASALASLPFLSESSQSIYTWFLVGFPFFLTVLFFLTLNFNAHSLFGPDASNPQPEPSQVSRSPPLTTSIRHGPILHQSSRSDGATVIVLSGPQTRESLMQHIANVLGCPQSSTREWVFYCLDERLCLKLSAGPMGDSYLHFEP